MARSNFDVVGLFGRSLDELSLATQNTLDVPLHSGKFPTKILYPLDFFPLVEKTHQVLVEEFIGVVETYLGIKRVGFRMSDRWAESPPEEAKGKSLSEYMAKSAFWSLCYDYYHVYHNFRDQYREKFKRDPFVEASPRYRWCASPCLLSSQQH